MPPSAITGTPCGRHLARQSKTAVICGTPTPATTRVVQIEPGPMPDLDASAPASISASAASPVATLPAMSSMSNSALIRAHHLDHPRVCPCAVSTTSTSTSAADERGRALERVRADSDRRADRRRPRSSLVACGKARASGCP